MLAFPLMLLTFSSARVVLPPLSPSGTVQGQSTSRTLPPTPDPQHRSQTFQYQEMPHSNSLTCFSLYGWKACLTHLCIPNAHNGSTKYNVALKKCLHNTFKNTLHDRRNYGFALLKNETIVLKACRIGQRKNLSPQPPKL